MIVEKLCLSGVYVAFLERRSRGSESEPVAGWRAVRRNLIFTCSPFFDFCANTNYGRWAQPKAAEGKRGVETVQVPPAFVKDRSSHAMKQNRAVRRSDRQGKAEPRECFCKSLFVCTESSDGTDLTCHVVVPGIVQGRTRLTGV